MSIWGYIFIAGIGWGVWSTVPSDNCVRVHRLAAPVRGAGNLIAYSIKNWSAPQTNDDMKARVQAAGEAAEQFIAQELYGPGMDCRWGEDERSNQVTKHEPVAAPPVAPTGKTN